MEAELLQCLWQRMRPSGHGGWPRRPGGKSTISRFSQRTKPPSLVWLVVDLALWKILISQLGFIFPIYGKNVPNHQPVVVFSIAFDYRRLVPRQISPFFGSPKNPLSETRDSTWRTRVWSSSTNCKTFSINSFIPGEKWAAHEIINWRSTDEPGRTCTSMVWQKGAQIYHTFNREKAVKQNIIFVFL